MDSESITTTITEDINNTHGWQKVTYAKKQRKAPANKQLPAKVTLSANGSVTENVFTAIETKVEERRKAIEADQSALYDPVVVVKSTAKRNGYSDYDESDEEVGEANGGVVAVEKKVKAKKVKVTVQEEAVKIDAADLANYLSDVTVSGV